MRNTKRSTSILFKALSKNFFKILIYYPKMIHISLHQKKYSTQQKYDYGMKIVRTVIDTAKIKIEAYGLENIPNEDGFYLCANHQEKFDPLAIWYTMPRQLGVILDDAACHRPLIREFCNLVNTVKLKRRYAHAIVKAYSQITKDLKKGINYMIFPEGKYEKVNGLLEEFHPGSFKSPQRAHCTILPVAILNSYKVFDLGFKSSTPIQIHYLKPILPEEYKNMNTTEIAQLVQSKIKAFLDQQQQ